MTHSDQTTGNFTAGFKDHLIQGVLIFASVLLAFWLTDRWHQQQEKRQATDVINAVIEEMTRNKGIMKDWMPYHKTIMEGVEEILGQDPDEIKFFNIGQLTEERGIFREILTHDSWDYLRQTNPQISIDKRLLINRVFRQQEFVDAAINEAVGFLTTREILNEELAFENYILFYGLISDLYYQQYFMIQTIGRALEELSALESN